MIEFHRTFLQNRSQHGALFELAERVVPGVLTDQRFAKNPSMEFVFHTLSFCFIFYLYAKTTAFSNQIYSP